VIVGNKKSARTAWSFSDDCESYMRDRVRRNKSVTREHRQNLRDAQNLSFRIVAWSLTHAPSCPKARFSRLFERVTGKKLPYGSLSGHNHPGPSTSHRLPVEKSAAPSRSYGPQRWSRSGQNFSLGLEELDSCRKRNAAAVAIWNRRFPFHSPSLSNSDRRSPH